MKKTCTKCGAVNDGQTRFCTKCGNSLQSDGLGESSKERTPVNQTPDVEERTALFGTKKIKKEKIVQQWTMLIEGADGQGERVLKDTIRTIEKVAAPDIHLTRQKRKAGGDGVIKASRQFLIAEHKLFDTYDMYISARDYGKQLFVAWYVLAEPIGFWRRFKRNPIRTIFGWPFVVIARALSLSQGGGSTLYSATNLFDTEELTAYITTVHHALTEAVNTMMKEQKIDYTKIEKRTQGFLNII